MRDYSKRQDYASLAKIKVDPPRHTQEEYTTRTHVLSALGGAEKAVEDAMWAIRGMDWETAIKDVREALSRLAEAYSTLGVVAKHTIVSTDAGDIPALTEAQHGSKED